MENSEEREKEIVRKTLSYYNKSGTPNSDSGNNFNNKRKNMKKYPLSIYVAMVLVVLAAVNIIARFVARGMHVRSIAIFSAGFLLGMLAMYVAVRVYKHK